MKNGTIIGIDPATRTGFATSSGTCGVWNLRKRADESRGMLLIRFADRLSGLLVENEPVDLVAIEEAAFGSINRSTSCFHSEILGVAEMVAFSRGVPLVRVVPTTLKKYATGYGRSDKSQMIAAARELGFPYADDDLADAWFLCRWGVDRARDPVHGTGRKP